MPRLGVCSWSLHPSDSHELVDRVRACGVRAVQLALTPIAEQQPGWDERETVAVLKGAGISVLSGMLATVGEDYASLESIRETGGVRPDGHWAANLARAAKVADVAQRMGVRLVTFHAGFMPHDPADPLHSVMIGRLARVGDVFAERGVSVAFETGQESAETLAGVMRELNGGGRPAMGVNFDPANMVLYGMGEPVAALRRLGPWVKQVHVKDAVPTAVKGTWGRETAVGLGAVDWRAFFRVLNASMPGVDTVIEREAGERRVEDIKAAARLVRSLRPGVEG
ncbi:MAG: sugar phosphate isomerase/epimerase [Phycisphaerales bacterium]|nr:sugar phosphate isomerase/epimerase [Phycisphaerales bacterium]